MSLRELVKLIIGCGYVGHRLAKCWHDSGEHVYVTTRSSARARALTREGLRPVQLDVTQDTIPRLPTADTVVFAVGFDRRAGHTINQVYVDGLRRVLDALDDDIQRFIYVSSTGVFGQDDGSWVDEDSPTEPTRDGGRACLAAERLLRSHPMLGQKAIILRLAGIYGPDRLPQLGQLQRGKPLQVAADAFVNLIHVDDVVRVIVACDLHAVVPRIYCVSDGHPVLRGEFYRYLSQLIGTAEPVFEPSPPSSTQAERARGDKRICNDRLVREMPISLAHPSYREGLAAIMRDV